MTSPFRSQMMEAAGLALSAWQVRLRGSPARRLITGPPRMTGSSGGTVGRREKEVRLRAPCPSGLAGRLGWWVLWSR